MPFSHLNRTTMKTPKLPALLTAALLLAAAPWAFAAKQAEEQLPLSPRGTQLLEKFTKELETLRAEVVAAVPPVDEAKKSRFLEVRAKWNAIPDNREETPPAEVKANEEKTAQTQTEAMEVAGDLLSALQPVLSSEALDSKLIRIAILTHGTPRGLAWKPFSPMKRSCARFSGPVEPMAANTGK
jgi:hypothetical protein